MAAAVVVVVFEAVAAFEAVAVIVVVAVTLSVTVAVAVVGLFVLGARPADTGASLAL